MKIDKNQAIPLYLQIRNILEEKITSKEWDKGYQLPSERELAESFSVSNITVKRAVIDLVDKGLLYRVRGKGTFVSNTAIEKDIYQSVFFMTEENIEKTVHKLLDYIVKPASKTVSKMLSVGAEDNVISVKRVGTENNIPVSIEYTYLPEKLFPMGIYEELVADALMYNIFRNKYGIQLKSAKNYFSATVANEVEAELLQVEKYTPLFVWERVTVSKSDQVIEYSKFIMRQDSEKYFIEVDLT